MQLSCCIFLLLIGENLRSKRKRHKSLEDIRPCYEQKFVFSHDPGQNSLNKVTKFSKTGQDQKTVIFTFAYFLTGTTRSSLLSRSATREASCIPTFVMLDIKFCCTSGEAELNQNMVKLHNIRSGII